MRSHKRIAHGILANGRRKSGDHDDDDEEVEEQEQELVVGKKFHCDVCDGNYSTKDSLRSHKRIAHGILANGRRKGNLEISSFNIFKMGKK